MEMVRKSSIALIFGAMMVSSIMSAADTAIAIGAPQVSQLQKLAQHISWPVLDLNKLSQPKMICAAALICLPFFLLHSSLPACIKNNWLFRTVIGAAEKKEKKTADGWQPKVPCSGIVGNIETNFLKPWGDTLKSVTPIIAILAFIGMINQAKH